MPNIIDVIDFTPIISSFTFVGLFLLEVSLVIRFFYIVTKVFKS